MFRCILFDLDGTLCDTLDDLANATNATLAEAHLPTHPREAYKTMVGNGITRLIERALPEAWRQDPELVQAMRRRMLEIYGKHLLDCTRPYPGMAELVESLSARGAALYVVTNKPQAQAEVIVNTLFPGKFRGVFAQRADKPTKPDPWGIALARTEGGFAPEECLFVGDSNVDVETALAGGVACAGVTWGFRSREELTLAGAAYIADTAEELARIAHQMP